MITTQDIDILFVVLAVAFVAFAIFAVLTDPEP